MRHKTFLYIEPARGYGELASTMLAKPANHQLVVLSKEHKPSPQLRAIEGLAYHQVDLSVRDSYVKRLRYIRMTFPTLCGVVFNDTSDYAKGIGSLDMQADLLGMDVAAGASLARTYGGLHDILAQNRGNFLTVSPCPAPRETEHLGRAAHRSLIEGLTEHLELSNPDPHVSIGLLQPELDAKPESTAHAITHFAVHGTFPS